MGVGEIGPANGIKRTRRNRKRPIKRIRTAVAADDITVTRAGYGADDRPPLARIGRAPLDRQTWLAIRLGMRSEAYVIGAIRSRHCNAKKQTARHLRRA
jgi:hypothetical protein